VLMGADRVLSVAVSMLGSTEALAALGACLRRRSDGGEVAPQIAGRLDAVLAALGIEDAVDELDESEAAGALAVVEAFVAQAADLVVAPGRIGWRHDDPLILLSQGRMSAMLAPVLQRDVVPALGRGLAERLDASHASFLDVGTGVGELAIAMCHLWPSLRVVGIDPWEPALVIARERIAAAGLASRIELRRGRAEALEDTRMHDLAWVPTFFIFERVLDRAIARVHAALRPNGVGLFGLYARPRDPLGAALADLRTVRHGGAPHAPEQLARRLSAAGFGDVEVLFDAAWRLPIVLVAGRRPSAA
jgi:SAM-dependent methyltransferase